ncbi:class I SAM-dependent methyltransferase [Zavarzinia sp. CC-PAN008]|uniref:class I SAM-dependent methyltransferase n=1 Tax=Zavarzinia sp. CC-PAN008 TaxID=3243332 RepID=UPI003F746B06
MATGFKDHFSAGSDAYRRYRPAYPPALFQALAQAAPGRDLAWDAGCGSGQATVGLAAHFSRVEATDASAEQIAQAPALANARFRVARAEESGLAGGSVDLVLVAQAIHWFDFDAFHAEVRRVLRPDGVLAVVGYGLFEVEPAIDAVVRRLYDDIVGAYWPPERRLVEEHYRTIPFPFREERAPAGLAMDLDWNVEDALGYVRTWSAVRAWAKAHGADPVAQVEGELRALWTGVRTVRWPLVLRLGRP